MLLKTQLNVIYDETLNTFRTRSTGTVHTSIKARLSCVVIQICDPDRAIWIATKI